MTSSTVATAPTDVYTTGHPHREVVRGPESRVDVPALPYDSELQAYCASKAAALNASEAFTIENAPSFDLISSMPSWVFGKDELIISTKDMRYGSTHVLINGLLTGN